MATPSRLRPVAAALLTSLVAAAPASAAPPEKIVFLVTNSQPSPTVSEPLMKALTTYLKDFGIDLHSVASVPIAPTATDAALTRLVAEHEARFAAWPAWRAVDTGDELTVWLADTQEPRRVVSFALRVPASPDATFYRTVALRLRGLVTAGLGAGAPPSDGSTAKKVAGPVVTGPALSTGTRLALPQLALRPESSMAWRTGARQPIWSVGGVAGFVAGPWFLGVAVAHSLAEKRQHAAARAQATTWSTMLAAQRFLWSPARLPRLRVDGVVAGGGQMLRTEGWLGTARRETSSLVVVFSAGGSLGIRVAGNASIQLTLKATLLPQAQKISIAGSPLFSTGWVVPSTDLGVQIGF